MSALVSLKNRIFQGNKRSVELKKNVIFSILIRGISIAVSFLLVPLTLGYVSSELYGIWLTISSIVAWLHHLDIGFTNGLKNKLGEAIAKENWERGRSLVTTTYGMMILIFGPLCIITVLCIPHINWAWCLNVPLKYNEDIRNAMYVLVVCFCSQMILNVLTAVISAFQKVALSSSFIVIGNIMSLIVIYIMTKTCAPSLLALSFAISSMPVIVLLIASFLLYKHKFAKIAPSTGKGDKTCVKDLFQLGAKFFLIQIQMLVLYQSTNVLISNVSSPQDVTSYNIAYKYTSVAMMIFTILVQPLWPAFVDAYAKEDFNWMKNIYKKMSKIWLLCAFGIIIMIVISPFAYSVWIGNDAMVSISMTFGVGVYVLSNSWVMLQSSVINGLGTIKLQTYITMSGLILHIPLALFLSHFIGALGVIVSMTIVTLLYSSIFTLQIYKILNKKAYGIWKA